MMKMRRRLAPIACSCLAVWFPVCTLAADIGWPVCANDLEDSSMGVEVIYQNVDRNYELANDQYSVNANGIESIMIHPQREASTLKETVLSLRLTPFMGDRASFFAEIGSIDDSLAESTSIMIGFGARTVLIENESLRFTAGASAHLVPYFDLAERSGSIETNGNSFPFSVNGDMRYNKFGAHILASSSLQPDESVLIVPYAGMGLSFLRGTRLETLAINSDSGTSFFRTSGKISEKSPINAIAGIMAILPGDVTVRIEGTFIQDSTFSAALGLLF